MENGVMDLNKLRNMSQDGQNEIAGNILQKRNPQNIAHQLMSDLEENASNAAKKRRAQGSC